MKVLVYGAHELGGHLHYRALYPMRELRQQGGHDAKLAPWHAIREQGSVLQKRHSVAVADLQIEEIDPDVVVIQLGNHPGWPDVIRSAQARGYPVVFEVDDWYGHQKKPGQQHDYSSLFKALSAADMVTVPSRQLAAEYVRWNPRVRVLPNLVDWSMWEDVIPQHERMRPHGRVRVGWWGNVGWGRKDDVLELAGIIRPLLDRHPNVDWVDSGSRGRTHDLLDIPEDRRVTMPVFDFEDGRMPQVLDLDIGVIPLADNRFNRCKSTLKGLEYGAAGIPWVASACHEEYATQARRGYWGYAAGNPREWAVFLDRLITIPALRRTMGGNARHYADLQSIQRGWARWETTYQEAMLLRTKPPKSSRRLLQAAMTG